jgi:hypothetical protein
MESLSDLSEYVSVFQEEGGVPTFYLLEYYRDVPVVAGTEKTFTFEVGDPQQFLTIELPDTNVIEILSVVDSDNNTYYEVDYLAQDNIIQDVELSTATEQPFYQPRLQRVPRRFVGRVNKNLKQQIQFGSGTTDADDEEIIAALTQIDNNTNSTELAIDPASFSTSKTYGKVPSNTTLTIRYTVGGGIGSNVPQNDLVNISEVVLENDTSNLSTGQISTLNQIRTTLSVTNEEKATGGDGIPSSEQIRQNALQFFSTQKRCVTAQDYKARVLSMPQSTIDLYLLGYDINGNLTTLNTQTKQNLSTYLDQFRLLTDGVNLLDGYIVNIGVDFEISVHKGYNKNTTLLKAIEAVKEFFDISKLDFNQPIYLSDLELQIANIDGVRTVSDLLLRNLTDDNGNYSNKYYPIQSAIRNKVIFPSVEPSVFEVKFPNQDIRGKVR